MNSRGQNLHHNADLQAPAEIQFPRTLPKTSVHRARQKLRRRCLRRRDFARHPSRYGLQSSSLDSEAIATETQQSCLPLVSRISSGNSCYRFDHCRRSITHLSRKCCCYLTYSPTRSTKQLNCSERECVVLFRIFSLCCKYAKFTVEKNYLNCHFRFFLGESRR
ncbi:uncharacterized protein LOC143208549 [Lasioglossum baleicum]|uniref:uncharacterized protein LOC143208549 n=1 Tax=Lasioglossum baleicum TaxID=434251 RepID=UPI003FCDB14C